MERGDRWLRAGSAVIGQLRRAIAALVAPAPVTSRLPVWAVNSIRQLQAYLTWLYLKKSDKRDDILIISQVINTLFAHTQTFEFGVEHQVFVCTSAH